MATKPTKITLSASRDIPFNKLVLSQSDVRRIKADVSIEELEAAPAHGGAAPGDAAMDEISGGYTGYVSDPDGHLWELVFPQQKQDSE